MKRLGGAPAPTGVAKGEVPIQVILTALNDYFCLQKPTGYNEAPWICSLLIGHMSQFLPRECAVTLWIVAYSTNLTSGSQANKETTLPRNRVKSKDVLRHQSSVYSKTWQRSEVVLKALTTSRIRKNISVKPDKRFLKRYWFFFQIQSAFSV